ncbi:MAG: ribosomal protein L11 methyltransferase [Desulfobacula sp. GWF2_41_7]|nr:MAG: ribosomal protein L11 methyltransferase [Desulfobacula sp. GWF2_41_7]
MKFKKITLLFETDDIALAEELICNIFFSFAISGVVCDIPLPEPDEGFGTHTLTLPEHNSITGYLPLLDSSDIILKQIEAKAEKLIEFDIRVKIVTGIVDEKEWADAWKAYFNVTRITDRIIIKPQWKEYHEKKGEILIHLDPGMAFGTGTHPTTAMCLKFIETFLKPGDSFLDVGTGSGILMIAAAKLGAGHLLGIDTDETAIAVARENLRLNGIDPSIYCLSCQTLDRTDPVPCDCIAANIIAQVIVDILPDIALRMTEGATALLSGIIKERKAAVLAALEKTRLSVIHEEHIDEWVTLAVKKETSIE